MIDSAVAALSRGEVIGLPTETLFGLAADPVNSLAMAQIVRLKQRPPEKGFIVLVGNQEQLDQLILPPSPLALQLMARFWPGPLTLVLPARPELSTLITGHTGYVAVRISPAPQVVALLALWRRPLISTSANPAGEPTPQTAEQVRRLWPTENLLVLDGVISADAHPSTVLQVDGAEAQLLRAGAVSLSALQSMIPGL